MARVGRPPKYETVAELEKIVKAYFRECDPHWVTETYYDHPWIEGSEPRRKDYSAEPVLLRRKVKTDQQPYTMAGLARRLGLSRQGLMEYKNKDQFSDTIKAARAVIEEFNERLLLSGKHATGAIFNLKVNFGYREHIEENPPPDNPIRFTNYVPVPDDEKVPSLPGEQN